MDRGDAHISDAGLLCLKALTNLKRLDLERIHFTADGVHELQKALPNTKVTGP